MDTRKRRIHIVGGGIGGLTAALSLQRSGHDVVVSEQADALAEVGAGLTLWPNALKVLDGLDLGRAARATGVTAGQTILGSASGRVLRVSRSETLAIHRAALQRILFSALPAGSVEFGRRCLDVHCDSSGVEVEFTAGAGLRSDLLVGADGINSAVRTAVLGCEPTRFSGYTAYRAVIDDWPARQPVAGEIWGLGRRFGIVPLRGGRLYWYATSNQPAQPQPSDGLDVVRQRHERWGFDIPEILARTDPAAMIQHDIFDRPPTTGWSTDRVALLGDAIHPTTPNLGQGAGMAMEDGPVLARALEACDDPARGFAVFEATRSARTASVTRLSRRIGAAGQISNPLAAAIRDLTIRSIPNRVAARQSGSLSAYDAWSVPLGGLRPGATDLASPNEHQSLPINNRMEQS